MRSTTVLSTAITALLLLGGCGSGDDPTAATDPGGQDAAARVEVPDVARPAVDDLAAELGIESGDVEDVEVEEVTWRDGSLGCSQQGEMYTQATVDGHRITITAGGETYEYHAGGDREPFRCEDPTQ